MRRRQGDDLLVRRAARHVGIRVAAVVAAAMLLLMAAATVLVVRGQDAAADNLLRSTAARAEDVDDPPPGAWIVLAGGNSVLTSPGLPTALTAPLARLRGRPPALVDLAIGERPFRVITLPRNGRTVQVVLDLAPERSQRRRLLAAMTAASGLALAFSAAVGVLLGRRAVAPMAQALALQRSFVADAGHELRTPLTLLSTRAQVLERSLEGADVPPEAREDAAGVVADARRLGEVLEDLLVAADPAAEPARALVDLGDVVRDVVASAQAHAGSVGVALGHDVAAPASVLGSRPALDRAVLSLVDNAVDHTPPGGQVQVSVGRSRRDVLVRVSDTGPGIAPADAPAAMRRFSSGGQRAGRAHYGLGLALTSDVVHRHGGSLRVVPGGVGATFELRLPAAP